MSEESTKAIAARSALMVAFHFPPLSGSSGIQRTLGFSRHLPEYGWRPTVLAPYERAYQQVDEKQLQLIPEDINVQRSFCLDAARHLAVRGRYLDQLAIPDRWISWVPGAVISGLRAVRRYDPSVIWSTYPIATSHIVGDILARWTKRPWIADFRDPMVEWDADNETFVPSHPSLLRSRLKVESRCVHSASALVFCTNGARDICLDRYRELDPARCHVISNGYDEWSFVQAENLARKALPAKRPGALRLLHSGTIYPTADRDPSAFFDAIASLKKAGVISPSSLEILFRASGHDDYLSALLRDREIDDIVQLAPSLPYTAALAEMLLVDGLLVFQGHTSNPAIPAKIYEYLRAKKPILALLDSAGSTAELLASLGVGTVAPIVNSVAIRASLEAFIGEVRDERGRTATDERIRSFSRSELTGRLAALFESLAGWR